MHVMKIGKSSSINLIRLKREIKKLELSILQYELQIYRQQLKSIVGK